MNTTVEAIDHLSADHLSIDSRGRKPAEIRIAHHGTQISYELHKFLTISAQTLRLLGYRGTLGRTVRALVVTNMWPSPAHPESGIFVADQVDSLRKAGADVDVFAFEGGTPLSYLKAFVTLKRRNLQHYDIVHAHFGLSAWVALAAKARVRAVTFHGTDLEHPRSRRISMAALRFIDLPAAASERLIGRIPVTPKRPTPIALPCGISTERFSPIDRTTARDSLGLPHDERLILLPSDPARPEKRADRARLLCERTGSRLITLGGIAPAEVNLYINAADLVVIPSEREGFGLALLEALACDVPVFSTPNGIAPEALEGVDGTLCSAWDLDKWSEAALVPLSSPTRINGRTSAARWSSDTAATAVLEAWRSALKAAKAAPMPAGTSV
ncbi:MAG: glycosyltransferase [Actinomycetes bacterium]